MKLIPPEHFICPLAAEDYFEILGAVGGEPVKRDDQSIANGPIHLPDDAREPLEIIRGHVDFVMGRAE